MDENVNVNRNYKDSVFSLLFSNPDLLRELYSALADVNLPPDDVHRQLAVHKIHSYRQTARRDVRAGYH